MDTQMEGQEPQPELQNAKEESPQLSQPVADDQQALITEKAPEQPVQVSSQPKNLAEESLNNPEQIAAPEAVKLDLGNEEQPKEALTLEAEKPSSGTAENTAANVGISAPIPAPVNNDEPQIQTEEAVEQNNQTIVEPQEPDFAEVQLDPQPTYYELQPQFIEPKEEKLFTITMNTYQACRLNSKLCNFGMRVEPIEVFAKKPNNKKRTQKKPAKLTYNPYPPVAQRKPIQKYGIAQQLEKLDAQNPIQGVNTSNLEESKGPDGEVNQMYAPKVSDGSDSGLGTNKIMRVDTKEMQGDYEDSDAAGLQPSPQRMSSRRHEHVAGRYQDMARGIKLDENEGNGAVADTQLRRAQSTVSTKPAQQANNNKKNIEENKAKVKALIENIKNHESFTILNNFLDTSNPSYEQFKQTYKIFTLIELQFDENKYPNSSQLKSEIFQQFRIRIDMYTSNAELLQSTIQMFNAVKGWFEYCDNLSLVDVPADKRPKPVPDGRRRPPPRPAPQPKPAPVRAENGGSQATQKIILNTVPPEMSAEDKNRLKNNIGYLTQDQKKKVVPIVKKCLQGQGNNNPIFEFELDQLTNECLRELEQYVDKEIKSNEKKRKRKEADKLRRQKRIQNKQEKPANKYPYPQSQGLEIAPAAVANTAEAALAAQQKIGGAVQPNQMAIQQQLAQLTSLSQLSQQQLQAQHMQSLLAQLQQNQPFPGMTAPVAQQQQFQRPPQSQQANLAPQNAGRKAQSESSSSSSESD